MKNPTAPLETTLENFHECEWKKRAEKAEAQVDAVHAIADEMANPECEANEVDDCDICQGYIKYANAIKEAIKGERS